MADNGSTLSLPEQRQRTIDEFVERFEKENPEAPKISETPTFVLGYIIDVAQERGDDQATLALHYLIEDREAS